MLACAQRPEGPPRTASHSTPRCCPAGSVTTRAGSNARRRLLRVWNVLRSERYNTALWVSIQLCDGFSSGGECSSVLWNDIDCRYTSSVTATRPDGNFDEAVSADRKGPGRRVTIRDVASDAGVSVSAVSKVLRNAYGVSPAMRANVTESMERLGYRPAPHEDASRQLLHHWRDDGLARIALPAGDCESINEELQTTPYQDILVTAASSEQQQQSIQALVDRQMDGLILISPSMDEAWLEHLGARVPTVVIARTVGATTSTRSSTTTTSGRGSSSIISSRSGIARSPTPARCRTA